MYGSDEFFYSDYDVDLLILLFGYSDTAVMVDGSGENEKAKDVIDCGDEDTPCKTLAYGAQHIIPSPDSIIQFTSGTPLEGTVLMNGYALTPKDAEKEEIRMSVLADGKIECVKGANTIKLILFDATNINSGNTFIHVKNTASLTINTTTVCLQSQHTNSSDNQPNIIVEGNVTMEYSSFIVGKNPEGSMMMKRNGNGERDGEKNEEGENGMCGWNTSVILFDGSGTINTIDHCTFVNTSEGALGVVNGATISLRECKFDSKLMIEQFSSFRRNIFCRDSTIQIQSSDSKKKNEEEGIWGREGSSLWIDSEQCTIQRGDRMVSHPLFIPELSSAEVHRRISDGNGYELVIYGATLIPCSLSYAIKFDSDETEEREIPFDSFVSDSTVITPWTDEETEQYEKASSVELWLMMDGERVSERYTLKQQSGKLARAFTRSAGLIFPLSISSASASSTTL